jgi:hypothetical protein
MWSWLRSTTTCGAPITDSSYAVVLSNTALPAVIALVLHILSVVRFFRSQSEKTNYKKKEKYHRA